MSFLTKQSILLLLSCVTIIHSQKLLAEPFESLVPVYSKGDNLSDALIKPSIVFAEVRDLKEIKNMPAVLTQDDLGDCGAASLSTIVQKHACDKWPNKIPDCNKNLPQQFRISSFGMMVYTNKDPAIDETFQPNKYVTRNMYNIIEKFAKDPIFILDSCKPFSNLINNFSLKGAVGLENRDKFFSYLRKLYESNKAATEANISDCPECLAEITKATGMNSNLFNLKKALTKDSYDKFMYSLFFDGCDFEDLADAIKPYGYPDDATKATPVDVKNKIVEGLRKNKPVLFPSLCLSTDKNNVCKDGHSIVISGFKKVCNGSLCKDVFKVQNSWGESWQKANNEGWVDADILVNNSIRSVSQSEKYVPSATVIWLEP